MARRPNILFSMADDQRHDFMGCAVHPFIETPGMDRLAEEGVRFSNGFTVVPLCAPSRASCLTGVYPHVHGVVHNKKHIRRDLPTWPQALQEAGYRTGFVGKIHFGGTGDPEPGFDTWVSFPGQGSYQDPTFNVNGERVERLGYHTDLLAEYALDFLADEDDRPWALCLWYKAPHAPFSPPSRYEDVYADVALTGPSTLGESRDGKAESVRTGTGPGCVEDWYPDGIFQAKKTWDTFVRDYARTVRAVDDALSTVLERLDEIGQADDTLVIHTADHGFFHGEFGLGNKRWLYDPSIRIPYLVRYPGVTANTGRIEEGLSTNLDIPATIYEAAGLDIPTICQGRSLLPVLADEVRETREEILVEYFYDAPFTAYPSMLCVRTRTEKLIRYLNDGDIDEFYDLAADPHERHNRAEDPAHRSDVERMIGLLDRQMEAVGFEFPDLSQDYSGYGKL